MFGWLKRSTAPPGSAPPGTMPPPDRQEMHTRDMLTRDMHLRAETIDENARSVEAVIATENRARVFDLRRMEIIDEILLLDGVQIPRQIPMLENHMRFSLITHLGSIRNIRVEERITLGDGTTVDRGLVGRLFFAEGDAVPDAERAWQLVRQGHLTDVSTGNQAIEAITIEAGETGTVNGRTFEATDRPLQITQRWKPREGSLTSVGADADAQVRSDDKSRGTRTMSNQATTTPIDGTLVAQRMAEQVTSKRGFEQIETELREATELDQAKLDALLSSERADCTDEQRQIIAAVLDVEPDTLKAE